MSVASLRNMSGERNHHAITSNPARESIIRLVQGAFVGFAATAIIGFTWGGWTLGKTAKDMADKSAATAVVAALAPICQRGSPLRHPLAPGASFERNSVKL